MKRRAAAQRGTDVEGWALSRALPGGVWLQNDMFIMGSDESRRTRDANDQVTRLKMSL